MSPWVVMFTGKPTHTRLYQNHGLRHHHSNKQAILATLSHRQDCKKAMTRKAFKTAFRENGYRLKQASHAHDTTVRTSKPKEKPTSVSILLFMQKTYGLLKKCWADAVFH